VPRQLVQGLLVGLAAALLAGMLGWSGALEHVERATWSWRAGHFAEGPKADVPIVLIALDQQTLAWGRDENELSWPWPREAYTLVLDFCRRAGTRAVIFDVLFSEPSLYGVEDDLAFAEALQRTPGSVGSLTLGSGSGTVIWPEDSRRQSRWYDENSRRLPALREVTAATLPVPELAAAFTRLGNVSAIPDKDGVFRRTALLGRYEERPVPSLSLAALLAADPQLEVAPAPGGLRIGQHTIVTDRFSHAILNFRGPSASFPTYSAAAIIQSELLLQQGEAPLLDPRLFSGAYVFFGLTAPGLYDLRPTPLDGVFPGMEIHATALDNLLSDDFLSPSPAGLSTLMVLCCALGVGALVSLCRTPRQVLAVALASLPLPLLAGFYAYSQLEWLPVAPSLSAVLLALGGGVSLNYATEGRKKREIRRAFNQYLHPTVIEQLVSQPERLRLGGEKRELSMFFSDLQGFTGLSETLDPVALTGLLNDYLTEMSDLILDAGGTIDKYEGDAIIAFWNAPLEQPDHALRAVRTALACQRRLAERRDHYLERSGVELHMRIGINSGTAVVGNLGSTRRFDYTMLGDAVNLAARLEGVNKVFGTEILISEATRRQLPDEIEAREVATVAVAGRSEAVTVFEPFAAAPLADRETLLQRYAEALELFRSGDFAAAATIFRGLAERDRPALAFATRCRELLEDPPPSWRGVWILEHK